MRNGSDSRSTGGRSEESSGGSSMLHLSSLRPEAKSLGPWDLNEHQKTALSRILRALNDARREVVGPRYRSAWKELDEGGNDPAVTPIDPFRTSRLYFLDGARGTGKTSVYLTLLELARGSERWEMAPEWLPADLKDDLRDLRHSIVWLQPIDMEPLPSGTNLMAAVMARLIEVQERFGVGGRGAGARTRRNEDLLCDDRDEDARLTLRRLAADLAISWDGNLKNRGAQVDPDAFAAEVRRVESARLPFTRDLWRCLEKMARAMRNPERAEPIFVLPVDDFDLNPTCALELMRLLRMISVPRLFFLVLGDRDLVESVFALKVTGELTRLVRHSRHQNQLSILGEDMGGISRQVAANAIRKLLPPSQTVRLERLRLRDAFRFPDRASGHTPPKAEVARSGETASTEAPDRGVTLFDLLARFDAGVYSEDAGRRFGDSGHEPSSDGEARHNPLDPDDPAVALTRSLFPRIEVSSLADLLSIGREADGSKDVHPIYSGAGTFTAPHRHLSDLWFALYDLERPESAPSPPGRLHVQLIEVMARHTKMAIEEDHHLSLAPREKFLEAVTRDFDDRWELDTGLLSASTRATNGRVIRSGGLVTFHHPHVREWRITPTGEPGAKAADRTESMLILLHDLLALRRGDEGIYGALMTPRPEALDWAFVEWGYGWREPIRLNWPIPEGMTFWELDILRAYWEAERARPAEATEGASIRRAAFVWVAAITSILSRRFGLPEELGLPVLRCWGRQGRGGDDRVAFTLPPRPWETSQGWKLLGGAVSLWMADTTSAVSNAPRGYRERSWLVALACLFAPESGIPDDAQWNRVAAFCGALRPVWVESDMQETIRRQRARRFSAFLYAGATGLFRALSFSWGLSTLMDLRGGAPPAGQVKKASGDGARAQRAPRTPPEEQEGPSLEEILKALDHPEWQRDLEDGLSASPRSHGTRRLRATLKRVSGQFRNRECAPPGLVQIAEIGASHPVNLLFDGLLQPLASEIGVIREELRARENARSTKNIIDVDAVQALLEREKRR